jgi:hypothetical protein
LDYTVEEKLLLFAKRYTYQTHAGQRRGQWPTSPGISAAMFERYNKNRTEATPSRNVLNSVDPVEKPFNTEVEPLRSASFSTASVSFETKHGGHEIKHLQVS